MASHMSRVDINLGSLRKNCRLLRKIIGNADMLAVIKSDAYGHGMVPVAKCLAEEGVQAFGVAEVHEGVLLRQSDIAGDIIVFLGADKNSMSDVIRCGLELVVFGTEQLQEISSIACGLDSRVGVHLKIDSGMGRLGISPDDAPDFVKSLEQLKGVYLAGIMSHFPQADDPHAQITEKQYDLFIQTLEKIGRGSSLSSVSHIANSAAILRFPQMHCDMVRPGISLYGCYPFVSSLDAIAQEFESVMTYTTHVIQVKDVPAGFAVSYGGTYITERPSRLAVLPVGYNNGYLRSLSNRAQVLVRGKRAPQRGRVCMNLTIIDVTDIEGVSVGDEVVLMGGQGENQITADEIAGWMNTINYEVLCLLGNNNKRFYNS